MSSDSFAFPQFCCSRSPPAVRSLRRQRTIAPWSSYSKTAIGKASSASEISRIDLKTPAAIIFKDGHHEKIAGEIDRIEFESGGMLPGKSHYIGKWEVGDGNGGKFFISLDADGEARKTTGSPHGTWAFVDGEAHISWDDGWHDAIRKVGTRHEKVAHEPGTSFDATPSNVTAAKNMDPKPI